MSCLRITRVYHVLNTNSIINFCCDENFIHYLRFPKTKMKVYGILNELKTSSKLVTTTSRWFERPSLVAKTNNRNSNGYTGSTDISLYILAVLLISTDIS